MIKKLLIVFVALLAALLAAGWLAFVLVPNERDQALGLLRAVIMDIGQQDAIALDTEGLDEIAISSENTSVSFSCAKTVAGKTLVVRGGWSGKFDSQIEGSIGLEPNTRRPLTLDASVQIDSLWSEHDQLTDALLTKGFFRPGEHPTATFSGVLWSRGNSDTKDQSVIHAFTYGGLFELNGIEKWIEFPATVQIYNDKLSLESNFSLDRQVFDVKFRDTAGFGLLTDEDIADDVAIRLRIDVPLGEGATAAREPIRSISEDDPGTPHTPAVTESASAFTETIPSSQIQFEMVLVPGDDGSGAEPFYLEKHEVTWDEFMPWVEGRDLASEAQVGEERAMKLRPSSPYGSVDRNFGMFRRPALGMSRLAAEQYCKWLSEQTGRAYRLPTEAEWCRAYVSGGGNLDEPPGPAQADRIATYKDNSWNDSVGDWSTSKVLQREPNTLGIHDMAGNVAEWVTATGEEHVVRGGHFESPRSELGVGRAVEDMDVWNRDYPNEPKSQWWYVNARWVGFRVACDP